MWILMTHIQVLLAELSGSSKWFKGVEKNKQLCLIENIFLNFALLSWHHHIHIDIQIFWVFYFNSYIIETNCNQLNRNIFFLWILSVSFYLHTYHFPQTNSSKLLVCGSLLYHTCFPISSCVNSDSFLKVLWGKPSYTLIRQSSSLLILTFSATL